ncbi:glycine receptor subunit alphaZ1-like, partial [Stegodyphus dumicola]|uniref:glycine receptor subunit alphaZ1-like n=1 Tax=Stegodyphus dumicola TaxID=202533 RepID=UPI0015AC18AE
FLAVDNGFCLVIGLRLMIVRISVGRITITLSPLINKTNAKFNAGNFTCIQVVFTLKRRLGYYMFHTYIPTCLIVIMSWISFWIRAEAVPARVTLCVTSLLTLSTQHAQSQKSLPPVSYIKAIDIFMSSCTVFVFASLMEYALVNILMGDADDDGSQEDSCLKKVVSNSAITTKVQVGPNCENTVMSAEERDQLSNGTEYRTSSTAGRLSHKQEWALRVDKFSRITFPLLFLILNAAYWSFYLFNE